jgi:hypothetical protein
MEVRAQEGSDQPLVLVSADTHIGPRITTHLALRHALAGRSADTIRAITGENAARVYGLNLDALHKVAARINAPTVAEVSVPLDISDIPDGVREYSLAFRDADTWV